MNRPHVIWTAELKAAAIELGRASYAYETSIPERAREMIVMPVGRELTPMQLDCVAMLRSRMHEETPEENAFNAAWAVAWAAAQVANDAAYDRALKPRP